jgi:integrase
VNRVSLAEQLVWQRLVRLHRPVVYLDLNHYIGMARAPRCRPKKSGRLWGAVRPLYRDTFWPSVWKPAVKTAGLAGLRIHDRRHTYVSLMVAAGVNPKEVSTWAGHSSVSFTLDRYGHLYDVHGGDVADRVDQQLSQGRPSAEIRALRMSRISSCCGLCAERHRTDPSSC